MKNKVIKLIEQKKKRMVEGYFDDSRDLAYRELLSEITSLPDDDVKWIAVEERLPEEGNESVLVLMYGIQYISEYDYHEEGWILNDEIVDDGLVTHWKPLPHPPSHYLLTKIIN